MLSYSRFLVILGGGWGSYLEMKFTSNPDFGIYIIWRQLWLINYCPISTPHLCTMESAALRFQSSYTGGQRGGTVTGVTL